MNKKVEETNIPNIPPKCNCQTSNYKRKLFEAKISDIKLSWSQFIRGKPILSWNRSARLFFATLSIVKDIAIVLALLIASYFISLYLVRLFEVDIKDDTYKYYFSTLAQVYGTLLAGVLIFIVFRYDNIKKALKESKQVLINYIRFLENEYNIHRYPELNMDEQYQAYNLINKKNMMINNCLLLHYFGLRFSIITIIIKTAEMMQNHMTLSKEGLRICHL